MIAKIIVLVFILLLVVLAFKTIAKHKVNPQKQDDVVDLEKDKDGKYKSKKKK